jgi:hypothetical protein
MEYCQTGKAPCLFIVDIVDFPKFNAVMPQDGVSRGHMKIKMGDDNIEQVMLA